MAEWGLTTHTSRLSKMTPSLSTSRKKGWSGAVLHSGMVYGARGRCCLSRSAGAAASSIAVSPDESPLDFPASSGDDSLMLGLAVALPSAPAGDAASASGCGVRSARFGAGGGGIDDEALVVAPPASDASDIDASGKCFGGGMEEDGLGFRGGGGGIDGSIAALKRGRLGGKRRRVALSSRASKCAAGGRKDGGGEAGNPMCTFAKKKRGSPMC
jgi:hypothetical protein